MTYYSQFGEDQVLETIFPPGYRGQCVEVGANDGVYGSTTLRLEQLGWTTILVEPNPALAAKLREERKAQVFECAASDRMGIATLHIAEGAPHADGVSLLAPNESSAAKQIARFGFQSRPIDVAVRTMDSILTDAKATPGIDFISIDVEGHEMNALRGLSLDRWKPVILLIEDNSECHDITVRRYLADKGYVPFLRTGVNDWYAHEDNHSLASAGAREDYQQATNEIRRARRRGVPKRIARKIPGAARFVRWLRHL